MESQRTFIVINMGASAGKVSSIHEEYKIGEVRSLAAHGGPSTRSQYIEMPQGNKLQHPTKQVPGNLEEHILRMRHNIQSGNSRQRAEATQWAKDNNAVTFVRPQNDRSVKFLM